ncbi:DUF397 domain-containing protein [Yinghuangia sp. YIM S10712]|uniref:DUF397 domain-containing protein n=1 Tax=Yinghuangia sp. YIM S10712 TaxID=3436930 RepID=UPI003F52BD94
MTEEAFRAVDHCTWIKSSHSGGSGGDCVEVAPAWTKSSYSGGSGGNCLEATATPTLLHVRDSKLPNLPILTFQATHWAALTNFLRHDA